MSSHAAEPLSPDIRYPDLDRLAWRLYVGGLLVLVCFSAHALIRLGYPYEAPLLGAFPFKIHPGTYLLAMSLLCSLASRGNPLRAGYRLAWREPLLAFYFSMVVVTLVWVVLMHGTSGAAFIVDTHWLPAIAGLALMCFSDLRRRKLLWLLAGLMAFNAVLALFEYTTQWRLSPLFVQSQASGFATEDIFRSSALFGHPLVNAKVTSTLLAIATFLPMRPIWRWLHVLVLLLSLLAFGGRFALVTVVSIYGARALIVTALDVVRGRFSYLQLTGGSLLLMLLFAAVASVVVATGLGERIFTGLYLDNSASVRLTVLSAYDFVTTEQLWFGTSARDLDTVALRLGLDPVYEAIENSWIYLSLQFGLILFTLWFIGFACLLFWLLRQAPALAGLGVLMYLLNATTTNTLSAKTISLGILVTYVVGAAAQVRANRAGRSAQAAARASAPAAQERGGFGRNNTWSGPNAWGNPGAAHQPMQRAGLQQGSLAGAAGGHPSDRT